jgi:hypothetical protein
LPRALQSLDLRRASRGLYYHALSGEGSGLHLGTTLPAGLQDRQ